MCTLAQPHLLAPSSLPENSLWPCREGWCQGINTPPRHQEASTDVSWKSVYLHHTSLTPRRGTTWRRVSSTVPQGCPVPLNWIWTPWPLGCHCPLYWPLSLPVSPPHILISLSRDHFPNKLLVLGSAPGRHHVKTGGHHNSNGTGKTENTVSRLCRLDLRMLKWVGELQEALRPL